MDIRRVRLLITRTFGSKALVTNEATPRGIGQVRGPPRVDVRVYLVILAGKRKTGHVLTGNQ